VTSSVAKEVERARTAGPRLRVLRTFNGALARLASERAASLTRVSWPSVRYREDPVAFFREVLGVAPWSRQIEILEAVRDHKRVAVKSGHKVSKSNSAAGIALWFYCSFQDARVIMTSTTARQVDDILWRELRMMRARGGLCVECKAINETRSLANQITVPCEHSAWIDGDIGQLARTGLTSDDFREVKGFTAREAEAVAGISGRNLLYILDEASGIKPDIYEAIEGNRAGGARVVLFSNPTKTSGEFYDAFNSKSRFYSTHTISSEETPNVLYGDDDPRAIPGLASREWIEEKREEWGEDSPLYLVRAKGEFAELEEGKIFSVHAIAEAEARWEDTVGDGRLYIGLDPAGEGTAADECVWCYRRGQRVLGFAAVRGLSREAVLMHTLGIVREHRYDREVPLVVFDREGKIGAEIHGTFAAYLASKDAPEFASLPVRASDRATRDAVLYDKQRDALAGNLLDWIRSGGAIPSDVKLAAELHAWEWREQEASGRVKITPKKEIRKLLGRSPDRYDALALAVWEPIHDDQGKSNRKDTLPDRRDEHVMDPYAPSDTMIDPYGAL